MVHKKHQSKRITTRLRAKNTKRAAEKTRKDKKAARLNPQSKKIKKDPGIPNLWPFKEKLLQDIEQAKAKKEIDLVNARKNQVNNSLANLASEANKRNEAFNRNNKVKQDDTTAIDPALSGKKDNSRKAYFREFKKVLDAADVILEVLDARDPLGCRTRNIEKLILNHPDKRIILILNKIDLIPKNVADDWIKYFRKEFPTIGFKASTQNQRTNISQSKTHIKNASNEELNNASSVGADSLIKLLKNYSRSQNIKTALTVGVIGYPNVGKSSLINSLKRAKVCGVGATPGFTKVAQEIHLDAKLKLLDCPGIVFGGFNPNSSSATNHGDVLLRNCIKVELLEDPISPVAHLLKKCKKENLMIHYNLPAFSDVKGFLVELARKRGFIKKGGIPDIEGVARLVLKDWNSGNISFYTLPPVQDNSTVISTEVVTSWAQEFDLANYDASAALEPSNFKPNLRSLVMDSTLGEVEQSAEVEFMENLNNADEIEEDMESEEESESEEEEVPSIVMTPAKLKSKKGGKYEKSISASELSNTPQINKQIKKQQKKTRKEIQKDEDEANALLELMHDQEQDGMEDDDDDDDDYDFNALDGALPMED